MRGAEIANPWHGTLEKKSRLSRAQSFLSHLLYFDARP